ncbi:hypothetical protein [Hyunsoonleella aquatilis]|nr:hypothetical protein [Hyunsoonleella aquatilis]
MNIIRGIFEFSFGIVSFGSLNSFNAKPFDKYLGVLSFLASAQSY